MFAWLPWKRARRARLRTTPIADDWWSYLARNVPPTTQLDQANRTHLAGLIQVFLDDKSFEGLGGVDIDDEIRVTIAGQACVLLLGLEIDRPYPDLSVIRVYPETYRAKQVEFDGIVASEGPSYRLGESSRHGYIVLTWRASQDGGLDPYDGQNVVMHEFAHQLDTEDGTADGAPLLHKREDYGPWAKVLGHAFEELQEDVADRRRNVLRAYGATNPAEFFAVATETFFEQPQALKRQYPDLYEVLAIYYRQDPIHGWGRNDDTML